MPDLMLSAWPGLDATTLFVVTALVAVLLGLLLVFAGLQDRIYAVAWWGVAYLVGGSSVAVWSLGEDAASYLPAGTANALVFFACGLMWGAARLFHGRQLRWGSMAIGSVIWLVASMDVEFSQSASARMVLSSLIVATYAFLTAAELWRERRKSLLQHWPAIFVPTLHGVVFLTPIPLAHQIPAHGGVTLLAAGWVAVFAIGIMLYVVGTAFIVLVLAKERAVRIHRTAALTDSLTGLLNRRGVMEAADQLLARQARRRQPVSVLIFDLDRFKEINDRHGHAGGDDVLRVFARTVSANLRTDDVFGRMGGEEFGALLAGEIGDAVAVAERLREAFAAQVIDLAGVPIRATVSIGAACRLPGESFDCLLGRADRALYAAKEGGRNRVVAVPTGARLPAGGIPPASATPNVDPRRRREPAQALTAPA